MSNQEVLRTEEAVHRRRLRLQQVREQSKDIAKKIRQRTRIEKFRHIVDLDSKKEKQYLERQESIVRELERRHAAGVGCVGSGHHTATVQGHDDKKPDLSKARGKTAAIELRLRKQKEIDEKKKYLDRKLQAREVANVLSRDKYVTLVKNVTDTCKNNNPSEAPHDVPHDTELGTRIAPDVAVRVAVDMSTQCDSDASEAEGAAGKPSELTLADRGEVTAKSVSEGTKQRLNLFAVSEDMPTSLRSDVPHCNKEERDLFKPSNKIAEHLLNRGMRLRETKPATDKPAGSDLKHIKQTILRTKTSASEGTRPGSACRMLEELALTREGRAEPRGGCGSEVDREQCRNCLCRMLSPVASPGKTNTSNKCTTSQSTVNRKSDVMVYNHSTRQTGHVDRHDSVVIREPPPEDDAYCRAIEEASKLLARGKENRKATRERQRVAADKQTVEREYEDTMAFLNSQTKGRDSRPTRTAHPHHRQHCQEKARQRKMQDEYRRIEKDCERQLPKEPRRPTLSCRFADSGGEEADAGDAPYSWVPVPDGDERLAVHKISNQKAPEGDADTHEYRSRHRHTPPTRDKAEDARPDEDGGSHPGDRKRPQAETNRIIIYKIVDSANLAKNVVSSLTALDNEICKECLPAPAAAPAVSPATPTTRRDNHRGGSSPDTINSQHLIEGIFAAHNDKGDDSTETAHGSRVIRSVSHVDKADVPADRGDDGAAREAGGAGDSPTRDCENKQNFESCVKSAPERSDSSRDQFYIGASGYIKHRDYELVIHLKKKDAAEASGRHVVTQPYTHVSDASVGEKHTADATQVVVDSVQVVADPPQVAADPPQLAADSPQLAADPPQVDVIQTETSDLGNQKHSPMNRITEVTSAREMTAAPPLGVSASTQTSACESPHAPPPPPPGHASPSTSTSYWSPPEVRFPTKPTGDSKTNVCRAQQTETRLHREAAGGDRAHRARKHKCKKHARKYNKTPNNKTVVTLSEDLKTLLNILEHKSHDYKPNGDLNSVMKKYVNEVLKLSEHSARAAEVARLSCSAVSTPAASVVGQPGNHDRSALAGQRLADILHRRVAYLNKQRTESRNKPRQNVPSHQRKTRCSSKIKSMNISKNVIKRNKLKYKIPVSESSGARPGPGPVPDAVEHVDNESAKSPKPVNKKLCRTNDSHTRSKHNKHNREATTTTAKDIPPAAVTPAAPPAPPARPASEGSDRTNRIADTATQTAGGATVRDAELLRLEMNKIKNMEKIANLTDKCTNRLNNLAKVLEKIRKNKSKPYICSANDPPAVQPYDTTAADVPTVAHEHAAGSTSATLEGEHKNNLDLLTDDEARVCVLAPGKYRNKPPTVISRGNLRFEDAPPHELSTVPEVDSPASRDRSASQFAIKRKTNISTDDSSVAARADSDKARRDSIPAIKLTFLDLSKRNELSLKPFQSLEEFAKRCHVDPLDEESVVDGFQNEVMNDEISSLHSEGSLPDVVSELLRRNIIKEPFNFDSVSSNTLSGDSSSSAFTNNLAHRLLPNEMNKPKSDTSESDPDLENTFKKMLGLGWASSTLKKTKERQALSSSGTSASSVSLKLKRKEVNLAAPGGDPFSNDLSEINLTNRKQYLSKNAGQQTSTRACMTVKELLTTELADKLSFCDRSRTDEEHYTSLYSTRPDVGAHPAADRSQEHRPGSRQRTSTPVQLYRSAQYDSSSNDNSDGMFGPEELSSVKVTSGSLKNNSNSDELSIPNYSLKFKKSSSN